MSCLALNASFEPLTLVPVRRAVRLVLDRKAEILEVDQERAFRSEHCRVPFPLVILLVRFVQVPRRFRRQVTNTCAAMVAVDGKRLEGVGVEPDVKVPFDIRFAGGKDVQLERAKDEMVRMVEASK